MSEANNLNSGNSLLPSTVNENTLEKLAKIEEKLKKLQDFSRQTEKLRIDKKTLLDNLINSNEKTDNVPYSGSNTDLRRVKFAGDHENYSAKDKSKLTRTQTGPRPSIAVADRSAKSLHNLFTNLHSWHGEVNRRKTEIETLKITKNSIIHPEEASDYEERIRQLETEKDEITEKLLHFVLQNVSEGKEEYQGFIKQLEEENKEMEDKMTLLQENLKFFKENNIALIRENKKLRQIQTQTIEDVEQKYRKSMLMSKSSSSLMSCLPKFQTPTQEFKFDEETEDKLSLDRESEDSFSLDKQIASWKMDEESMRKNLKKLEQKLSDMEVIQMKLTLVKRYVSRHGTGNINRNTLIDPSDRGSVRR